MKRCKKMPLDDDIINALYKDGDKSLDDLVPDPVSEEEAHRMMDRAIKYALARRRKKLQAVRSFRKIAFSAIAALALLVVVTPAGRALASDAVKEIVHFFDTYIFVQSRTEVKKVLKAQHIPEGEYQYDSIAETARELGNPLVGLEEGFSSVKVELIIQKDADAVLATYITANNDTLNVTQMIYAHEVDVGSAIYKSEDNTPVMKKLFNGVDIYVISNSDGVLGYATWDNIVLVASSNTMSIEELANYVERLHNINEG